MIKRSNERGCVFKRVSLSVDLEVFLFPAASFVGTSLDLAFCFRSLPLRFIRSFDLLFIVTQGG
ncbi:hypothetical protein TYRP_019183 [Tyrophagus putrescentiae]|nr:hypothetical protein TYRP_019183 [Tyrophagus putrescentiae]